MMDKSIGCKQTIAACAVCGSTDIVGVLEHRNQRNLIAGWFFVCSACMDHVPESDLIFSDSVLNVEERKNKCCSLECEHDAEWEIQYPDDGVTAAHDNYTLACSQHVGSLLMDGWHEVHPFYQSKEY